MSYAGTFILAVTIYILPVTSTGSAYASDPPSFLSRPESLKKTRVEERFTLQPRTPRESVSLFQEPSLKEPASRDKSANRILTQALLGPLATGAGLVVALPLAAGLVFSVNISHSMALMGLVGAAMIPVLATSSIIYLAGKGYDGDAHGSFWNTLGGTAGFSILSIGLMGKAENPLIAAAMIALPTFGGIMAYTESRKNHQTGLINIEDGKIKPGLPSTEVNLIPRPDGKKEIEYRMNMMSISF